MLVIQDNDTSLAVLVNYESYLIMQNKLEEALRTIQMLKAPGVAKGLHDAAVGKLTPLSDVDPSLT